MVEGEQRVSLPAAEVGLELHHRIPTGTGQALHGMDEKLAQPFRDVGAAEELYGVAVFAGTFAPVYLGQVGRELCQLVAAGAYIGVRVDDLPPGFQPGGRRAQSQLLLGLLGAATVVLVAEPLHLLLLALGFDGLLGQDGGKEPFHVLEHSCGVGEGEGLHVGPVVAKTAQLAHDSALKRTQGPGEDVLPEVVHHSQLGGYIIQLLFFSWHCLRVKAFAYRIQPPVREGILELSFDERKQA